MIRKMKLLFKALLPAALVFFTIGSPAFAAENTTATAVSAKSPAGWVATHPIRFRHVSSGAIKAKAVSSVLTPSQIKSAYGINLLSATGAGQTIAIVDAYGSPTIKADLATFDQQYGLPSPTLTIAQPQGKPKTDGGWALETSLDVEWAHALAPSAKILLVEAKTASNANLLSSIDYATSHGATVVSNSWGGSEFSTEKSDDSHFTTSGITYLASSGDDGEGSSWPAASPDVVAVGGTTLNLNADGSYASESAWSGSGGAKSSYESAPTFQSTWKSVIGTKRGIPDVAFDADPNSGVAVYTSTPDEGESGWFQVGGTSFSAPAWAALIALADQNRLSPLSSSQTLSAIYSTAGTSGSASYSKNFHDISSGSNGYSAKSGYDLVTGIGSPQANSLVSALSNY